MSRAFITGAGMVSSLGLDLTTSCAAARAGIRRARSLDTFVLSSQETGADSPPVGHSLDLLTRGFEGDARLLRLLVAACEGLAHQVGWGDASPATRVYLAVPDPLRVYSDLDLIRDDDDRQARQGELVSFEAGTIQESAHWLWQKAVSVLRWKSPPVLAVVSTGHTGFTTVLDAALRDLASARVKSAIVGGVDSLLDLETLLWLHDTGRLKFSDMPVGIEPGEAAACVLLESAPPNDRPLRIPIVGVQVESETERPADALLRSLVGAQPAARSKEAPSWLIVDHDGTEARAAEWGQVQVRLGMTTNGHRPRLTYPASSFGDVGAAFGAVSTCMAIAAWARGCAPASSATILAGDRPFRRAAHVVSAP